MDNNSESQRPEIASSPREWAKNEFMRIGRLADSAETQKEDVNNKIARQVMLTGHFLISTSLTPPESKQAQIRNTGIQRRQAQDAGPATLHGADPKMCMQELASLLLPLPIAAPLFLASAKNAQELEALIQSLPEETPEAHYIKSQAELFKERGGRIVFPGRLPSTIPMSAEFSPAENEIKWTSVKTSNAKAMNDSILLQEGYDGKALAMIQPKKS